jgi:hypothetical protein
MSIRVTVGSFIESHRAKSSRPDRRNFIPQTDRLFSEPSFPGRRPQLRGAAPNAPTPAPVFPKAAPIFPTTIPIANTAAPIFWKAAPKFQTTAPIISATAPIFPKVAPIFPAPAPNFSPADLIYNSLSPRHLCENSAKIRKTSANFRFPNSKLKIKH